MSATPKFDQGNSLCPPITSIAYGLALALTSHMESYDHLVSQPTVLGPEASERWREVTSKPGTPLADPPLPLDEFEA